MAEKLKVRKLSLGLKFSISFIAFFLFIVVPFSFWIYQEIRLAIRESLRENLADLAALASTTLDVEKHKQILRPEQENSLLYEEVRQPLKKIQSANPKIDSIYTLRPTEKMNIWTFVVDTYDTEDKDGNGIIESNEERAHVGEEYDVSELPELQKALAGPTADYEINCDKWGCWLSGYAPIKNQAGESVAVLGVDISAERILALEKEWQRILSVFLFFILSSSLIFILIVMRLFTRPILRLTKEIEKFAGDVSYRLKTKTGDEFEIFAQEFNRIAERIEKSHRALEAELKEKNKLLEKTNKKLEETDKMRKEFVSHTAHELRSPLNVFRWSVEMLQNEDLGKINLKQREILNQVYQSNERLLTLVNDLLDVSRIDEARLKVEIAPCQIEEIIDEAAKNLAIKIKGKRFDFIWQKPTQPLPKVKADKNRVLQVFLNILGNAVKFTPVGGKIEIKVKETNKIAPQPVLKKYGFVQKDKRYVLVSISDTGLGIPKNEQEKMFARFFRGSNVQKAQIEGTGLGMAIVFEIIKLLDGGIWFESEEGVGTTFYFTLPVV